MTAQRWVAAVLLVVVVGIGVGCGGPTSDRGELSDHDVNALERIDGDVLAWNRAAGDWSSSYKAGDNAEFLRTVDSVTEKLHKSSIRIRLAASQLEDERLERFIRRLGNAYRRQFRAIVKVNNSVVNNDIKAGQRAIALLQRTAAHKIRVAERIVDAYPELGPLGVD